jgi:hypothetical protein
MIVGFFNDFSHIDACPDAGCFILYKEELPGEIKLEEYGFAQSPLSCSTRIKFLNSFSSAVCKVIFRDHSPGDN